MDNASVHTSFRWTGISVSDERNVGSWIRISARDCKRRRSAQNGAERVGQIHAAVVLESNRRTHPYQAAGKAVRVSADAYDAPCGGERVRSDLWVFTRSFCPDWTARMSGGASLVLTLWGIVWNHPIKRWHVFLAAFICYFIASFRVWQKE